MGDPKRGRGRPRLSAEERGRSTAAHGDENAASKRQVGRPPGAPSKPVSVRLPLDDYRRLARAAAAVDMKVGTYARHVLTGHTPHAIPALNARAWSRLGEAADALIRIGAAAQRGLLMEYDTQASEEVEALRREVQAVRSLLLGARSADAGEGG